jgi:hypothetical protein
MGSGLREARVELGMVACFVALVAVAIAGCGGGGSETVTQTQTSAAPLTKAEFITQGDAICARYNGIADAANSKLAELGSIDTQEQGDKVAEILRNGVDELTPQLQAIQGLRPPPQDAQVIGSYFTTSSAQLGTLSDLADAYEQLDAEQIQSLSSRIEQDKAKAHGIAQGYGFKVCGQD